MRIIRTKDYDEMSKKAAEIIASQITLAPDSVLGMATGSTMEGLYGLLAERCSRGELDFSGISTVNLDEYVGLPPDHDQSYRYYMDTNLFDKVNIDKSNTNVPNGMAADTDAECRRYDGIIEDFGFIDIQLLGLGNNGHIGFNEPSDSFASLTNCVELTDETIESNSRFFDDKNEVPKKAITMGIKSISQAGTVLLCANGQKKADALKKVLTGSVTPQVPGSILQLHPNLIVVADDEALSKI